MKNETKIDFNEETNKWDVSYRGFNYMTFSPSNDWKIVRSVDTEDEAKKIAADCLDFND